MTGNPRYTAAMADLAPDPMAWRPMKAPSLVELEVLASDVFQRLPRRFRDLCTGIVIQVDDFPTEEVLDHIGAESEFDLLGLFQGIGLPLLRERAGADAEHDLALSPPDPRLLGRAR